MSLRRRIAGLILLVGAIVIGLRFFQASEKLVSVDIHYRLPPDATGIEAVIVRPGASEEAARFMSRLGGVEARQQTRLPPGTYTVDATVTFAAGSAHEKRTIEVKRSAEVVVDLSDVRP